MRLSQASTLLALAAIAQAHMIMDKPRPYGYQSLNNSPLSRTEFPCKQRPGAFEVVEMNFFKVGEPQLVNFNGTAVHAGGSCQFSITTDEEPTDQSKWGVIHSIEGDCPAAGVTGNLPGEDPKMQGPDRYSLTIPKEVPSGRYTLAWTWINHQGQFGEFYMNCAPLVVEGGAEANEESKKFLNDLPAMFVANLDQTCLTATGGEEAGDFVYPDGFVGQSVIKKNGLKPAGWLHTEGCASMTNLGKGAGTMGLPSQATDVVNAKAPINAPDAAGINIVGGNGQVPAAPAPTSGGVFAPGASSAPPVNAPPATQPEAPAATSEAAAATSFTTTLITKTAAPPAATSAPQAPVGTGAPAGGAGNYVDCPQNGAIVCVSSTQYGICNWGKALVQDVAAGTVCEGGAIGAKVARRHGRSFHRRHGAPAI